MGHQEELGKLRDEIGAVDDALLNLMARRMELAVQVGEYKKQHRLPVKDYRVEKLIIDKVREGAARLNIYPDLAESVFKSLIRYSVIRQDEMIRHDLSGPGPQARRVLVIGGRGLMGRWMAQYFHSTGHEVSVYDKYDNDDKSDKDLTFPEVKDLTAAVRDAGMIVLTTPLSGTADVIRQLIPLQPRGLVMEICSLKSPVIEAMQEAVAAGLKMASLHPMFGPDAAILAGRNFILCEGAGLQSDDEVAGLFNITSASLIRMPVDKHDELMSYVLGASHLINLAFANLLQESGIPLKNFEDVAGTTFKNQMEVTRTVVPENQDLYYDIQSLNRETPALFASMGRILKTWQDLIAAGDADGFRQAMENTRIYFGR